MKKILFHLIWLSSLMLVMSCNKVSSNIIEASSGNQISFHAFSSSMTKGAELDGSVLPNTYGIYAAATQLDANGNIENAAFFNGTEQLFATAEEDPATGPDSRVWSASPNKLYWPIGSGIKMDFLTYAIKKLDHQTIASGAAPALDAADNWRAFWNNAGTNSASMLSFNGVDTYRYQSDVLFAAKNGQSSAYNAGTGKSVSLSFNHAQALLIFNVKNHFADAAEANTAGLVVDEIGFYTPARLEALRADQVAVAGGAASSLAALQNTDVTLKTVGTFTVDNSRNNLVASWNFAEPNVNPSNGSTRADNATMPDYGISPAVSAANRIGDTPIAVATQKYGEKLSFVTENGYAQLGETLLIPEQDKVNFTIKYHFTETPEKGYFVTFNDFRGTWEMGKKYIYNIDMTVNEITVTENVDDYTAVVSTADIDGNPSSGTEDPTPVTPDPSGPGGEDLITGLTGTYNGHDWVDIGLRDAKGNKILFATTNVGASEPYETGDYYPWAGTYKNYTVDSEHNVSYNYSPYDPSTLSDPEVLALVMPYIEPAATSTGFFVTKYQGSTNPYSYDFVPSVPDGKTTLESGDDIATVSWGGKWHIPDREDFMRLITATNLSFSFMDMEGVNGVLIYGTGDYSTCSIFIPLSGSLDINNDLVWTNSFTLYHTRDCANYYKFYDAYADELYDAEQYIVPYYSETFALEKDGNLLFLGVRSREISTHVSIRGWPMLVRPVLVVSAEGGDMIERDPYTENELYTVFDLTAPYIPTL